MILSGDQLKALGQGEPIPVTIDETECIVIHRDVFDRLKNLLYDDSEMKPRETYAAILNAIDSHDEDPKQYLEYLKDA
ncbi:MAG: hypothetical protein ABI614_17470 [Planctomycetota bacterium]